MTCIYIYIWRIFIYIYTSLLNFTYLFPIISYHHPAILNKIYAMPPSCYFTLYNYIYFINFCISPRSSSTQNMDSKQCSSHLECSNVLSVTTECLELKSKPSWCPQGHNNVQTVFVTIRHLVQKFKCHRQTHRDTRPT